MEGPSTAATVVGTAKGILLERFGMPADRAFAIQRRVPQRRDEKLNRVAEELVRTGETSRQTRTGAPRRVEPGPAVATGCTGHDFTCRGRGTGIGAWALVVPTAWDRPSMLWKQRSRRDGSSPRAGQTGFDDD